MNNMGANLLEGSLTSLSPHVRPLRWLVGWVCLYVVSFLKSGKLHFHIPLSEHLLTLSFIMSHQMHK